MHRNQHRDSKKKVYASTKQNKATTTKKINLKKPILMKWEIGDLPIRKFRVMVIKLLSETSRTIQEQSKNFNKEIENIKK